MVVVDGVSVVLVLVEEVVGVTKITVVTVLPAVALAMAVLVVELILEPSASLVEVRTIVVVVVFAVASEDTVVD